MSETELIEKDISMEVWREYDFADRTYHIDQPTKLFMRLGGTTHRVVDALGVVHCVPAPGYNGCVLRWLPKNQDKPVSF